MRHTLIKHFLAALFAFLCLMATEAKAQQPHVESITSETIALNLPHGEFDYSRDMASVRDSLHAQDNVWLAFYLDARDGITHEIPPQDSLRTVADSLHTEVLNLLAENSQLATTISEQSSEIASLEAQLIEAQAALAPLKATVDSLRAEESYAIGLMREMTRMLREN